MDTDLQLKVLRSVLTNHYTAFNGSIPQEGYVFDSGDFEVWNADIGASKEKNCPRGKQLSGVCASLVQAGLAFSTRETFGLTEEGFKIAMESYKD